MAYRMSLFADKYIMPQLWPQLELSLQRDFAHAVLSEDLTLRTMLGEGGKRPRKVSDLFLHCFVMLCD